MRYIKINEQNVPILGQGTSGVGEQQYLENNEIKAIRHSIELGMTLIDTAEMYGNGKSELLVSKAIRPYDRKKIFLVSKILPQNVYSKNVLKSCENSLKRLGVEYLDLYLLHWKSNVDIKYFLESMQQLKDKQYIKNYGVSNFDTIDMQELYSIENSIIKKNNQKTNKKSECFANQVLYHIGSRGVEWDLIEYCKKNNTIPMAYCPLALGGKLSSLIFNNNILKEIADKHKTNVSAIILAFIIKNNDIIAIPKSTSIEHINQNIQSININLDDKDLDLIQTQFPKPTKKTPLDFE